MNSSSFVKYLIIFTILASVLHEIHAAGCKDDQSCTDLCGYAGAGTCVDGKYCKCANCPQRSLVELVNLPKVCTLDPFCFCPAPTFSLTSGKFYTGHRCVHKTGLVCICFCLPTTPASLLEIIKCPFPKNNGTASTSTASTAGDGVSTGASTIAP